MAGRLRRPGRYLIVQLRAAGVGSVFDAMSVARTWKVCGPSARFL